MPSIQVSKCLYLHIYKNRSHGVTVSTLDFESSDPSSNLGGTSSFNAVLLLSHATLFAFKLSQFRIKFYSHYYNKITMSAMIPPRPKKSLKCKQVKNCTKNCMKNCMKNYMKNCNNCMKNCKNSMKNCKNCVKNCVKNCIKNCKKLREECQDFYQLQEATLGASIQ